LICRVFLWPLALLTLQIHRTTMLQLTTLTMESCIRATPSRTCLDMLRIRM
jgi:hypothetical protein